MKAIIFHGTDSQAGDYWQGWLKKELEKAGLEVEMPHYPSLNNEPIEKTLAYVLPAHEFTEDTILVGHSAGGPLILAILEKLHKPIKQAILVGGYCTLPDNGHPNPALQPSYNWERIKTNVKDIIFINSVNDPWLCDDKQGRAMFDKLGGTLIIKNEGHFGSGTFKQTYPQFPLVRDLILEQFA